jgi:hypothetical protein
LGTISKQNKTKKTAQKRAGGVAQGVCPKFNPHYCQKKKKKNL